jgi:NAD(P)-dependent dehydrogenase (short-subunit alcohol dehydrogenase family)
MGEEPAMKQLRFDGRTAIVTGAGGNPSLGRAYALLLAERGASVVVNDIGHLPAALGYSGVASAEAVAAEIRALGGQAVADTHSVADEAGAAGIVQTALNAFGSIDILVNNAGICRVVSFEAMTAQDFRQTIEVNLMGTVHTCRAAWPHMKARGYGRIVNISSGSMVGYAWQSAYAAAKAGVFSFTRSLAVEGKEHGIAANTVMPGALTRMVYAAQAETSPFISHAREHLPPEFVAPTVAFLAHETCPCSGECLESMGGQVDRMYLARTAGFSAPGMSIETIAERWQELMTGTSERIARSDEADPRDWHIKPYMPAT